MILRLLGRSDEPLGVNSIARKLDLIPSTALHILRVLMTEELVAFDPSTKRYELSVGILSIARSALRRNSFVQIVQPAIDDLATRYNVTMLGVEMLNLNHMVVVAMSPSSLPVRLHADLGSRFPALISATGRCLVAFGTHKIRDIEARFSQLRWAKPPTFKEWQQQIEQVAKDGFSADEGQYIAGVSILAVPIFNGQQKMTHTIVCIGLQDQIQQIGVRELASEMMTRAREIERALS